MVAVAAVVPEAIMNYLRSILRPPRSVSLDDLPSNRSGIPEHVARGAALRLLAALRARHAKICAMPATSDAFERLMLAIGRQDVDA
jgi:hypothetical protein